VKTRRGAGKRKAITRAKQPAKAAGQSKAASGGERPHKETQSRGKSRTANLPDRITPWGSYPTNDFVAALLSDIRDEIKGLRGDLRLLREECLGAKGAGEQDSGVPNSSPPREKEVIADYEFLRQQTERVNPAREEVQRVSKASLETLLVKMLRSSAYQRAEHPTPFTAAKVDKALDDRTYRLARAWLRNNDYISAEISPRTKKMNPLHGGEETVQEYWTDMFLTEKGVALARHIDGRGLPHLKHMDAKANKAAATGPATGSTDGLEEQR